MEIECQILIVIKNYVVPLQKKTDNGLAALACDVKCHQEQTFINEQSNALKARKLTTNGPVHSCTDEERNQKIPFHYERRALCSESLPSCVDSVF